MRRIALGAAAPPSEDWTATVEDPQRGSVRLNGRLSRHSGGRELVVLVHGLGGSCESIYLRSAATAASALGMASLRINMRGADGATGDFYHGGLSSDLAVAARDLSARFDRVYILGFSLGGHLALRLATEVDQQPVAAVAAVCSPLDLGAGVDAIDRPLMAPYRHYVLRHLKANYASNARFGELPTSAEAVRSAGTIRQWDALTVVPRFGFRDTDDYYARASVGPRLRRLRRPALLVASEGDPMIPPIAIRPHLEAAAGAAGPEVDGTIPNLTVRWLERGGHLGYPKNADLRLDGVAGATQGLDVVPQILLWLRRAVP